MQQRWSLATAESCTGGWISQVVTAMPGSSGWFDRSFVTYSNIAKQEMLAVPKSLILQQGAVSKSVALAMVRGAISRSHAEVAIAVSGIAGPGGGSPDKPVGTVWIAWKTPHQEQTKVFTFSGDRLAVRQQAVICSLQQLLALVAP